MWPGIIAYLERLQSKQSLLDLGCGNGRLLTGIKVPIAYLGLDFSKNMISEARRLHPGKKFIAADITRSSTWKKLGRFDAIFCIAVLHHIGDRKDQVFILEQMINHLKPGGFALISVWNLWHPRYWKHHLSPQSLKLKLKNWRWLFVPWQHRVNRFCIAFTPADLTALLTASGWHYSKVQIIDNVGKTTSILRGSNLKAEFPAKPQRRHSKKDDGRY